MLSSSKIGDAHPMMIPWVIVITLLFGVNAFTPDLCQNDKHGPSKDVTFSQAADEFQVAGRAQAPLLKLPALGWGDLGFFGSARTLLLVAPENDPWLPQAKRGVVHGRAPPAAAIA